MAVCSVLVPREGTPAAGMIDRASAIVSDGRERDGSILVWYEGNRYGADNLKDFHSRTVTVAGRLASKYPTAARALFPRDQFIEVASFSTDNLAFAEIRDPEALSRWAGEPIERIRGTQLSLGMHPNDDWPTQEELSHVGQLGGGRIAFRSRAGQYLVSGVGSFEVLAQDDPRIRAIANMTRH